MKSRLLCDEFPNEMGSYIYNSEYSYINREFEYLEKFEFKCLEQFNICKSLYQSLNIWEKDEVVKYWTRQLDWYIEEEDTFSPRNIKKFDLVTYFNVNSEDKGYDELEKTDPYPIFYVNYYNLKFKKLLINFFLFEEQSNLTAVQFTNYVKPEFNPLKYLNLPENKRTVELQNELNQFKIKQKTIVCFLHLLRDSEIRPKGSFSNIYYCKKMCDEFNLTYEAKIAKIFSYEQFNSVDLVKAQIFPTLAENIKTKLEIYITKMGY